LHAPIPGSLTNNHVTLKPLSASDAEAYLAIGGDPGIWKYLAPEPFESLDDAQRWIEGMLKRAQNFGEVAFSVYDNKTTKLAGSSSYLDIRTAHGGLEIGFTWYGKEFQRTHVNTATKLALFANAFEVLDANRVQLQTDSRNQASQRAIERLGATKEGVLRKHKVYPSGYVRDSVMYSVTKDEWAAVKAHLEELLRDRDA